MGEVIDPFFGNRDADHPHQLHRLLSCRPFIQALMHPQHLGNLIAAGEQRIQCRHWLLKNHCNLITPDSAHLIIGKLQQILPFKLNLSGDFSRRTFQQPHNGHGGNALAAAGLTDDTNAFALVHLKAEVVDGTNDTIIRMKVCGQI